MREPKSHLTDVLFVLALFTVFIITALIVALMGAEVYSGTVRSMNRNFGTQTSLTYVSTKIRQSDESGGVYLDELGGVPVLVLEQEIEGETFQTLIYHYDGWLRETFILKGMDADLQFGVPIMQADGFSVTAEGGNLLRITCTAADGIGVSALISTRTGAVE
ncbi:MAG: DUF4860 domain-containing protein [Oscillospiraceae bacterium]|nr:DUF4860 domain-containing protein [Oscillospiraceae bacterium]